MDRVERGVGRRMTRTGLTMQRESGEAEEEEDTGGRG